MIYLDNASTTKPSQGVKKAVFEAMECFGNPSSMHKLGIDAEKLLKASAENIARACSVDRENIYFTSGGTEANNAAILGYCRRNKKRGRHVITTKIEHPSVSEAFSRLEKEGFEVTRIGVLPNGRIDLVEFENALRADTLFVSCMWVNNETGNIQPIEQLKPIMKKHSPNAVLHVDAVQAFGKIKTAPRMHGVDLMSVSGHKIHAIKGIGALYVSNSINIEPYIIGGGQQKDVRSGTENVVGIAALGQAVSELKIEEDYGKVAKLKNELRSGILAGIPDVKVNGEGELSPYILNVSFVGIKAEILLHALEAQGVFVSTGSACSTNKPMPSHVLDAMGCTKAEIMGAVRFSLSSELEKEDITRVVSILKKEVEFLRKVMK